MSLRMEIPPTQQANEETILPAERGEAFLTRPVGMLALGLIFTLAAGSVYAFLEGIDPQAASAQTAATAASAHPPAQDAFTTIALSAKSAIVVDTTTMTTLYERNADTQLPLASLTKVPLVLAVSEVLPPDSIITVDRDIPATSNTGALRKGSTWRMQDMSDFTLVGSSNGGSELLARVADAPLRARYPQAPEGNAAVWLMNDIAQRYGGANIYFLNPSGLDESATQSGAYGTARAVAALYAYAASSSPVLFAATTRKEASVTSQEGRAVVASNTDEALDHIPGIVMGKTGFTDLAGGNLAVVFNVKAHTLVAVVLGSTKNGRFTDMRALVEAGEKSLSIK